MLCSKSSMGWFYGYRLSLAMNRLGEIACSALSNGHIADKRVEQLVEGLAIKLHAVHGYISQQLKSRLIDQRIDLIIYRRKNRQAVQLSTSDKHHLKQRYKIEPLFSSAFCKANPI